METFHTTCIEPDLGYFYNKLKGKTGKQSIQNGLITLMNEIQDRDGPWPDPTRAHFWPAVNKNRTTFDMGTFWSEGENLTFLGEINLRTLLKQTFIEI